MRKYVRIIIKKDDKYLMIKEEKGTTYNQWNFPGGKIEPQETPTEAAIRELLEEVNLTTNRLIPLVEFDYSFDKKTLWHGVYFICDGLNLDNLKIMEPEKCSDCRFFDLNEVSTLNYNMPPQVLLALRQQHSR